jgi:hypothetical protein
MFRLVVALLLAGQASATTVSGDTFERDVASEDFAQHSMIRASRLAYLQCSKLCNKLV